MSLRIIIFTALSLSLAACATPTEAELAAKAEADKPDPRQGAEVKKICFSGSISGFSHTTRTSVVVSKGSKDYLITTRSRCSDLDHAEALVLKPFSSCLSRGDKLIGFDSPFGGHSGIRPTPCYIDKIYEWDKAPLKDASDDEASE